MARPIFDSNGNVDAFDLRMSDEDGVCGMYERTETVDDDEEEDDEG